MHPIAVDGSSALSAFLSHHQPPQPHMQAPAHTSPLFLEACHKGAAISQPRRRDAASLQLL